MEPVASEQEGVSGDSTGPTAGGGSAPLSVELVGPTPPPYGGVAVHVERLYGLLQGEGLRVRLWDMADREGDVGPPGKRRFSRRRFLTEVAVNQSDVIHVHSLPWWLGAHCRFGYADRALGHRKLVVSLHNTRIDRLLARQPFWRRRLDRAVLAHADAVIFPNEQARQQGIAHGCPAERGLVIPEYIPIPEGAVNSGCLPEDISKFCQLHGPLLAAGAYRIATVEGVDIYGLDLMIEAMTQLRRRHRDIGLVICLPGNGDDTDLETLRAQSTSAGVASNILWVTRPLDAVAPLWAMADIFLRPTATDGDAMSVREALAVGTPVLASDCVPRPEGCRVFTNRSVDSLVAGIDGMLGDPAGERQRVAAVPVPDHGQQIIALYRHLVGVVG